MPVPAPLPANECERLAALHRLDILDTAPESAFDNISELASDIFRAPIALVSLVDTDRQWFKSRQGLDAPETHRDLAFCAHAILNQENLFYVPDATKDFRFADSPLVVGPPNIRTYLGAPLVGKEGYALGTLCVIWDKVTDVPRETFTRLSKLARQVVDELELRRLVAAEIEAKKQVEKANQLKSQFMAVISHEIRTPLGGVIGMLELLGEEETDDQKSSIIESAHSSAKSLLHIVNDILDFSRLESRRIEFEKNRFEPAKVVRDVANTYHCVALDKGIEIRQDAAAIGAAAYMGDALRIQQILSNLAGNAIKFTASGTVTIGVGPGEGPDGGLRFSVTDTGIGIPADKLGVIFDDFTQVDASVARKFGGSGLGLAICKRLTEMMGGQIGVTSVEGKGSSFYFTIPAAKAAPEQAAEKAAATVSQIQRLTGLSILVAEDNPVNQKLIGMTLERQGAKVTLVDNGQKAVDKVASEQFDTVLMDINMPVMDGVTACKAIRQMGGASGAVPIIALTASALEGDEETFLAAGLTAYVSKPIDRDLLVTAILDAAPGKG